MYKYIITDFETGSKEVFGRTANYLYNDLVAFCIKTKSVDFYTQYVHDPEEGLHTITSFISDEEVLVAHNLKFEALYLWKSEDFQEWLKAGGRTYCTQLGEYFLTSFQTQWAGLRDIAVRDYGCPIRTKNMEEFWEKGVDTGDIPEELVLQDCENDVRDTHKIYLDQEEKIKRKGRVFRNMLKIQNDFLLATTEMEYNGMYLDLDVLEKNKKELEAELKTSEVELQELIKEYWR